MSEVLTKYTLDASQPQAELDKYRQSVKGVEQAEGKAQKSAETNAQKRKRFLKEEQADLKELEKRRRQAFSPRDIEQYNRRIAETQGRIRNLKGDYQNLNKSNNILLKQFKAIGAAALAAFSVRAIVNFAKESVKLYDIQIRAEAELLRALDGRRRVQERLITQAKERQRVTLFGDEETIQAQSVIAAFVKEEETIKRLTVAAQDLATAKGMDLRTSADLITKSFASSTNALSRYGITIEGAAGSTERLEQLTGRLGEAFGGASEVAAQQGLGAVKQLQNNWNDLREDVGGKLIPVLNGLVQELQNVIGKGDEKTGTGFLGAGFAIGFAEARTARFIERLESSKSTLEDWIQIATVAFDPLGFSAVSAADNIDKVIAKIEESGNALAQKLLPSLRQAQAELLNVANPTVTKPLETLKSLQEQLAEETRILTEDLEVGTAAYARQAAVVDRLKRRIESLQDPFKAAREAQEADAKAKQEAEKAIDAIIKALDAQKDQLTLTNDEILRGQLLELGATEATIERTLALQKEVEALKAKEAAEKAIAAEVEKIITETRTQEEQDAVRFDRLNELYKKGVLDFDVYARALNDLQDEIDERQDKALEDEAKRKEARVKLAEELVNEFGKSAQQLFNDTVDAIKAQAEALLAAGELTKEQFNAILDGLQSRVTEFSAMTAQAVIDNLSASVDSFKEFLTILGEDSEKFVQFQKVLTGIQIALDTAKAIAGVVAAAAASTNPIEFAAKLVAGLAIVAVNMAKANQLFKGAGDAPAPTYAQGGGFQIQGSSHAQGGVGLYDNRTGKELAQYEGKEWLYAVNSRATAENIPVLKAINEGKLDQYVAKHYAPFAAIDARPNRAQDKGFAANIAKALQIEFDDRLEGALKRIERKTGTTKVTNLHELGKYFKRNYWGPNTRN